MVSRMEVLAAVLPAFDERPCGRAELIRTARGGAARTEVVAALDEIPDWPFTTIGELWDALAPLPAH